MAAWDAGVPLLSPEARQRWEWWPLELCGPVPKDMGTPEVLVEAQRAVGPTPVYPGLEHGRLRHALATRQYFAAIECFRKWREEKALPDLNKLNEKMKQSRLNTNVSNTVVAVASVGATVAVFAVMPITGLVVGVGASAGGVGAQVYDWNAGLSERDIFRGLIHRDLWNLYGLQQIQQEWEASRNSPPLVLRGLTNGFGVDWTRRRITGGQVVATGVKSGALWIDDITGVGSSAARTGGAAVRTASTTARVAGVVGAVAAVGVAVYGWSTPKDQQDALDKTRERFVGDQDRLHAERRKLEQELNFGLTEELCCVCWDPILLHEQVSGCDAHHCLHVQCAAGLGWMGGRCPICRERTMQRNRGDFLGQLLPRVLVAERDVECPICLEGLGLLDLLTQCGPGEHRLHLECYEEWVSRGDGTCPMCRSDVVRQLFRTRLDYLLHVVWEEAGNPI
mmetsp:Transcript_48172/g.109696  ORF Transcript_48172/g.109696 Transcript_48172/m.109696 type:complete len:451 (-) Transcript_48172:69-1421(-)